MENSMFNNKTILVTGGTGSFGKKFITTILEDFNPKKVIIYSRDELKQFEMQHADPFQRYNIPISKTNIIRYFIGDVRDLDRLKLAMEGVDIVLHAAALKQVPAAEYNPFEAVKTNIHGAQNVIDACFSANVGKVIALSTDKACAPINLYGATKLTSDKLFIAANNIRGKHNIKFSVVRYGNVMGSRGSVIPFFNKRKNDGVLPITDENMTRFSITLQEGVDFVINCLNNMWGGELFIPKIPSYLITDVAQAVAPDCKIQVVGIRPGEKIHEEMITATDAINTIEFDDYFVILPTLQLAQSWDNEDFIQNSNSKPGQYCAQGFSYNSFNNPHYLTVDELVQLIKNNTSDE
jgi:UDP-N-acetylglucosamine 4,6-dehydratase (inverting)